MNPFALLFILIITFVVCPTKTYAYLDPGSGSFILQILLAGFFGALYSLKRFSKQIKSFIERTFTKNNKKVRDGE